MQGLQTLIQTNFMYYIVFIQVTQQPSKHFQLKEIVIKYNINGSFPHLGNFQYFSLVHLLGKD